jgi:hypothetical protein
MVDACPARISLFSRWKEKGGECYHRAGPRFSSFASEVIPELPLVSVTKARGGRVIEFENFPTKSSDDMEKTG